MFTDRRANPGVAVRRAFVVVAAVLVTAGIVAGQPITALVDGTAGGFGWGVGPEDALAGFGWGTAAP